MKRFHGRSISQRKADVINRAKGNRTWHILLDASSRGETIEEAARLANLTLGSTKKTIYRRTGHYSWPVQLEKSNVHTD